MMGFSSLCAANDSPSDSQGKDTDYDGLPDVLEERLGTDAWLSDTDGDGLDDAIEDGLNLDEPLDSDYDGLINALDVDDDNDGVPTVLEAKTDTDGDGWPDYIDLDSDNDGVSDRAEAGVPQLDTDNDGVLDYFDIDQTGGDDGNGDGIDGHQLLPDLDRDGIPDIRDLSDADGDAGPLDQDGLSNGDEMILGSDPNRADSDGDSVADALEAGENLREALDTDGDGLVDLLDQDDDDDGVPTRLEVYTKGRLPQDTDTDSDGVPDYLDEDDDNDGWLTRDEDVNGDGQWSNDDSDNDGTPDYRDSDDEDGHSDDDGDGLSNSQERTLGSNPTGRDTDKDGIHDALEIGLDAENPIDSDGDGTADFLDTDDDGDGIATLVEGEGDRDGDGRVNYLDVDPGGYFYCAADGRIVSGIEKFRVLPEKDATIVADGSEGVISWRAAKSGTYSLQFILPKGLMVLPETNSGKLYVTKFNGDLVSLGRSEDVGREGYLADFNPKDLPGWYSAFSLQEDAPPIVNMNIPLIGGECGDYPKGQ